MSENDPKRVTMTKLDRYILTLFIQALIVVTIALGATIIIINMVEELRDFFDHDVPLAQILEYYLYYGGWVIKTFLPMFVLLAVLFSVSLLARRNEILAMKAGGRSLYRITLPLLLISIAIAGAHFYYNEFFFPPANQKRVEMKAYIIEAQSRKSHLLARNIYRQIKPGYFYTIGNFNVAKRNGSVFRLYLSENNQLKRLVVADKIIYEDFVFKAVHGEDRLFEDGASVSFESFDTLDIADIKDKPDDFARKVAGPEEMSLGELVEYIALMKRTGAPYLKELVNLKTKFAFPLSSAIVVLISVPLAANPRKGGVAVSFAVGALISLVYFVLFKTSMATAYSGKIPVEVGVWGVNTLFLATGVVLMIKARK